MLVLVGKTCSGKNTIRDLLVNDYAMDPVITHTTRPPRDGEENYVDYIFINNNHFHILEEEGWFAEVTSYDVASGETWYYGSAVHDYEDSDNKIIILNPEGLKSVRRLNIPIFTVLIDAPINILKSRLLKRGGDRQEADRRLKADQVDFADIETDAVFINYGNPDLVAKKIYECYQHYLFKKGDI